MVGLPVPRCKGPGEAGVCPNPPCRGEAPAFLSLLILSLFGAAWCAQHVGEVCLGAKRHT